MQKEDFKQLEKIIDDRDALADLSTEVKTPEEKAYLDSVSMELQQKQLALGQKATELVLTPDGTFEERSTLDRINAEDQDRPGAYGGHGRE
jgi:hypothetical protein